LLKSQLSSDLLVRAVRYAIGRTHATAALRASETEYRRLFESAKDGILILDPATGQINDANQFLIDLLGLIVPSVCLPREDLHALGSGSAGR
jgi:PAS domain-containing protein